MNNWTTWPVVMVAMAALAASGAVAQPTSPRKLAHDPFDRRAAQPSMGRTEPQSPAAAPVAQGTSASAGAAPTMAAELRAVMIGGARPLVNLGGTILGIGDSMEGFLLVEVRERSAVFTKDGKRIELALGRKQEP
jgi:hypothetical protein